MQSDMSRNLKSPRRQSVQLQGVLQSGWQLSNGINGRLHLGFAQDISELDTAALTDGGC